MGTQWTRAVVLVACSGVACQGAVYKTTGSVMSSYAVQHMVPTMMESSDLNMACEAGVSMGSFLLSFQRVTAHTDRAALVTLLSAGMCAEQDAWDAELRGLRALHRGQASEVQDARIEERAAHAQAAKRFYAAYLHTERAFNHAERECPPKLSANDEALLVLGLSAGVLASLHDRSVSGAGVPADLPLRAARASLCVNNQTLWGVPRALRAAVWISAPGTAPAQVDPWQELVNAVAEGDAQGVRLARAFWVQANGAAGHDAAVRAGLMQQAAALKSRPANPAWRLLDSYATRMITHESDKLWTAATGHRTPYGELGAFWDAPQPSPSNSEDDLLSDLHTEEGA